MRELSIFIDESGDFGVAKEWPSFYLVTLVFHEQANLITEQIYELENSMRISGFDLDYIHTGPAIRREDIFWNIINKMKMSCLIKSEARHFCVL